MKRGVVPYRKIGRCVLVDLGELDQALARFKRNAIGEPTTTRTSTTIALPRKRRAGRMRPEGAV
jgi:ribosomal protein S21